MSIEKNEIVIGGRYLCDLPNCNYVQDYVVAEISPINLQKIQYVKLKYEDESSGIIVSKWVIFDIFLFSVLEKLEEENNDVRDDWLELPLGEVNCLKSEIKEDKLDYLQDFVKIQTEYLKMLIEEKKDTDKWKG